MNILLIVGPPGAGKGTQSTPICKIFGVPKISTGDMLRERVAVGDDFAIKLGAIMKSGGLVSDDIVLPLLKERISRPDCARGFLLDGFPRTVDQAQILDSYGIKVDYIIELDISDDEIVRRLSGRWVHQESGRTYHVVFNPPKVPGKDDITGDDLIQREDDKPKTILHRLEVYHNQTKPLLAWYEQKQKGTIRIKIDASLPVEEVKENILVALSDKQLTSRL